MRLILLFLLISVSSFGQSKDKKNYSLVGTSWLLVTRGADLPIYTVTFLENGELFVEGSNDTDFVDDFWKQKKNKVTICYNNKYATYTGIIKDGLMVGTAKNENGKKWEWSAELVKE